MMRKVLIGLCLGLGEEFRHFLRSFIMSNQHQSGEPWEWTLAPSTALRVPVAGRMRWLVVTAGRAWLTRSGAGIAGGDVWLAAGERHALPAGSEWVVEGWPQARLALLEAPARRFSVGAGLRRPLVRPEPCVA
jgi:hypothetical protein